MLRYWTAPSPTKTRETPHCLAKTLPFLLTPKAKSATTTTTTTLWVLWYIFSLNNKPLFYSYSDFVFVLFGKLLARNTYCLQTLFYTCDTSRRYNPTTLRRVHLINELPNLVYWNRKTAPVLTAKHEKMRVDWAKKKVTLTKEKWETDVFWWEKV